MAPPRKPFPFTEDQLQALNTCHQAGEGLFRLVKKYGGSSRDYQRVAAVFRERGWSIRSKAEGARLAKGCTVDLSQVSPERWEELYWAPGSGYPSTAELSERFGVSDETIRRYLHLAGITLRTRAEQYRINLRKGRSILPRGIPQPHLLPPGGKNAHGEPYWKGKHLSRDHRHKISLSRRRKLTLRCDWCGTAFERTPSQVLKVAHHYCCVAHSTSHAHHRRRYGEDAPRPLLLDALREAAAHRRHTYETLERLADQIGAGEAEILAVLETPIA